MMVYTIQKAFYYTRPYNKCMIFLAAHADMYFMTVRANSTLLAGPSYRISQKGFQQSMHIKIKSNIA